MSYMFNNIYTCLLNQEVIAIATSTQSLLSSTCTNYITNEEVVEGKPYIGFSFGGLFQFQ